ncbi:MAG: hypothetical protein WCL39_03390 [Armatimonadota bacterium]
MLAPQNLKTVAKLWRDRQGMTIVEIVFAMSVLLSCALVYAAAFPTATTSRQKADNRAFALSLADRQMESIRDAGYAQIQSLAGLQAVSLVDASPTTSPYSITNVTLGSQQTIASALPSGIGTMAINTEGTGLVRVTVTVVWYEKGRARTVVVSTLVCDTE